MGLSSEAANIARQVISELCEVELLSSVPIELEDVDEHHKKNPYEKDIYGYDEKPYNSGWENIFFFIRHPSIEFYKRWDKLKERVPNTSFTKTYEENPEYTIFGWF